MGVQVTTPFMETVVTILSMVALVMTRLSRALAVM
jgi:hypothetical protein